MTVGPRRFRCVGPACLTISEKFKLLVVVVRFYTDDVSYCQCSMFYLCIGHLTVDLVWCNETTLCQYSEMYDVYCSYRLVG